MGDYEDGFVKGLEAVMLVMEKEETTDLAHLRTQILDLRDKVVREQLKVILYRLDFEV